MSDEIVTPQDNARGMTAAPVYAAQWSELRTVRRRLLAVILAGILGIAAWYLVDPQFHITLVTTLVALVWTAFWVTAFNRYMRWPCPRCGKSWQFKPFWGYFSGPWDVLPRDACPHCGLPIDS
jgi:hypothetical protein